MALQREWHICGYARWQYQSSLPWKSQSRYSQNVLMHCAAFFTLSHWEPFILALMIICCVCTQMWPAGFGQGKKTAFAHSSLEPHKFCMFIAFIFLVSAFPFFLCCFSTWLCCSHYSAGRVHRKANQQIHTKEWKIFSLLFLCCQPVHLDRRCC